VTSKAVEVTKVSMKAQDEERKKFMMNIRDTLSEKVRARQLWQVPILRISSVPTRKSFRGNFSSPSFGTNLVPKYINK
jgi:hypothetical protein